MDKEIIAFVNKAETKLKHSKALFELKVMLILFLYLITACFYLINARIPQLLKLGMNCKWGMPL